MAVTPALAAEFSARVWVALCLTSGDAFGGRQAPVNADWVTERAWGLVRVAALCLIVADGDLVGGLGECWVLPNGVRVWPPAGIIGVATALVAALAIINRRAGVDVATVAHAVISESGVAESIACEDISKVLIHHNLSRSFRPYPCRLLCTCSRSWCFGRLTSESQSCCLFWTRILPCYTG